MRCLTRIALSLFTFGLVPLICGPAARTADGATYSMTSDRDNTLFQFDPADDTATMKANGLGNFFGAGTTRSRSQLQRGLIHFDFSGLPAGAAVVPGTASLQLYVVDSPSKDPVLIRPFWLVALGGLAEPWGEGNSRIDMASGAGGGTLAQLGDATWFHTQYDTSKGHDMVNFIPGGAGYWDEMGALGDGPLDPWTAYGTPAGTAGQSGEYATLASASMETDINAWLADPASNFGWIVLGDETVVDPNASTKRGFATHEHAVEDYRPVLAFEFAVVPEPGTLVMLAVSALALMYGGRGRRRR